MALIVQDVRLEHEAGWKVVNQLDVNDPMADGYGLVQTPEGLRSYIVGKPYAGACGSLTRRVIDGFYHPSLSFEILPDECVATNAQANEFDVRIQLGEWNYNLSGQLNLARQGMWQLVNASEAWVDTDFFPGNFPSHEWTPVRLEYALDIAARTFATTLVEIGDAVWEVPESYRHVPAGKKNWESGTATVQVQIGLNQLGGACSHKIRNVVLWWA